MSDSIEPRKTPFHADLGIVAFSPDTFQIAHIGRVNRGPLVLALTQPMTHAEAFRVIQKFRAQLDAMERALGPIPEPF